MKRHVSVSEFRVLCKNRSCSSLEPEGLMSRSRIRGVGGVGVNHFLGEEGERHARLVGINRVTHFTQKRSTTMSAKPAIEPPIW